MVTRLRAVHPVLGVRDVAVSTAFYRRLGFVVTFQDDPVQPRYVGLQRDDVELHLQWADATQFATAVDRPVVRFAAVDVDALHAEFHAVGALDATSRSPWTAPGDTPWGTREFHLHDPDRNGLQFYRTL
jgi:catechol 2,3-dioxygenase-like lactoylglutathione lyase family enzyme